MRIMRIQAIAVNTFREAIRDKILYSLLFFALIMIGASLLLGKLALGEYTKIIMDVGLAAISLFGTLIAIFVGITLVNKEIEKRTVYTVVSKPIRRWEFIVGKYLGLALTLFVEVVVMSIGFFLMVIYAGGSFPSILFVAIGLIYIELLFLTAIAVFFSSFSTPTLSGLFTLSAYIIGHLTEDIKRFGEESESAMVKSASEFLYYLLPNLENFNIKNQAVHGVAIGGGEVALVIVYGVIYISLILFASTVIFQGRDFK